MPERRLGDRICWRADSGGCRLYEGIEGVEGGQNKPRQDNTEESERESRRIELFVALKSISHCRDSLPGTKLTRFRGKVQWRANGCSVVYDINGVVRRRRQALDDPLRSPSS